MRPQRLRALASSHIKGLLREPATLFLLILFPIVLTLFFGFSFGAIGGSEVTYSVAVVNHDDGANASWSHAFIENLSANQILRVEIYPDNQSASSDLSQGKVQALMVIPQGFSESCASFLQSPDDPAAWTNSTVALYLDKGSMFAISALPSMMSQTLAHTLVPGVQSGSLPVQVGSQLIGTNQVSAFDVIAPGLFAFASIFLIMTVSGAFTSNREKGLLKRFATTPVSPSEFMMSYVAAYLVFAVLQTALVFAMAYLMGYRPEGGAAGMLFGVILLMVFSVCNVGFGLITATLAKSPGAATGLAFLFILPQMFLGTFVGSMLSDNVKAVSQFVPSYYVTNALTSVYARGASLASPTVLYDTAVVCAISLAVLGIGIVLFRRYGNR